MIDRATADEAEGMAAWARALLLAAARRKLAKKQWRQGRVNIGRLPLKNYKTGRGTRGAGSVWFEKRGLAMPSVMMICPAHNMPIPTGLEATGQEFSDPQWGKDGGSVACPRCGQPHAWNKSQAYLEGDKPKPLLAERFLVLHHGLPGSPLAYRDATIYMTGHAYHNCIFERCTLIIREGPTSALSVLV